jgi:hypothetical protein
MREREKLEREANHRRQVFVDGVREGRRALAPVALLDGAIGILATKFSLLRPLQDVIQRSPVVLVSALGALGLAVSATRSNRRRKSIKPQRGPHAIQFKEEK